MRRCEVCGSLFGRDDLVCPRDNVALTDVAEPDAAARQVRTAYLGRFDPYEADLVVDILRDADIIAMPKISRTDPNFTQYGSFATDQGVVLVDASKVEEARRIIDEELPRQLEAIALEMEALAIGMQDGSAEDDGGDRDG